MITDAAVRVILPAVSGLFRRVWAVPPRHAVATLQLLRAGRRSDPGVPSEVKPLLLVHGGALPELGASVSRRARAERLLQNKSTHHLRIEGGPGGGRR